MSELNNLDSKTIDFLTTRRSTVARMMDEPGPSDDEMKKIMEAGMRVPDHGRLTPWRFIISSASHWMRKSLSSTTGSSARATCTSP